LPPPCPTAVFAVRVTIGGDSFKKRLGRPDPNGAIGTQSHFDDVTLFHTLPTEMPRLADPRVNLYEDKKIDFKDFAELAVWWLDEQLWP